MATIAIVEDEAALRADLVEYLSGCGHQVVGCDCGAALDAALAGRTVDILILDVNLPGEDGFSIAARLRDKSEIGIIMLTARNLGIDRVVGLELGADVYLVKPVDLREIEAQVRTLSRRMKLGTAGAAATAAAKPAGADWTFDQLGWLLIAPDGVSLKLTGNERVFVSLLVANPGEAVSRNDLFAALGKRTWSPEDRSVDSLVRRLRAKGEQALGRPLPIEAVHGIGYAFAAPIVNHGTHG
ncbi:MAG: response regulator transcription factor [Magnetospirillum sp.]|nr:response regulator transcription factor [Magnetospirillum sp.]